MSRLCTDALQHHPDRLTNRHSPSGVETFSQIGKTAVAAKKVARQQQQTDDPAHKLTLDRHHDCFSSCIVYGPTRKVNREPYNCFI